MSDPKTAFRMNRKLFVVCLTIIGAVVAAISYCLIIPTANYHSQRVIFNVYENRASDFSVDVTGLVRGLGLVAIGCIVLGLSVGSAIARGQAETLLESRKAHFAPNASIDALLLKSGLVSGTATSEGVRFELTDRGRQFIREYEQNERKLGNPVPNSLMAP